MSDLLFPAGQVLSVLGLVYGWFLSLTYCERADEMDKVREKAGLLHHLAMA